MAGAAAWAVHGRERSVRGRHEVEVLDLMFAADPARETANRVRKCDPDIVGLSIRNIDNCNFEVPHFYLTDIRDQVVRSVRSASQRAKIVIGGSAVNVSPADTFAFLEADYALVGEGEEALPEFLRALEEGTPAQPRARSTRTWQGAARKRYRFWIPSFGAWRAARGACPGP